MLHTNVQSVVNGHHGEASVNVQYHVEEATEKDIAHVLHHHQNMVVSHVSDIQNISFIATIILVKSMAIGDHGVHMVNVQHIVMGELRRDIDIVTALRQLMVVVVAKGQMNNQLNAILTDAQSMVTGEDGANMATVANLVEEVWRKRKDFVTALHLNSVVDLVKDQLLTNVAVMYKDVKWMAIGQHIHHTVNVHRVAEEVFKRDSDIATTHHLYLVVKLVMATQRPFVSVISSCPAEDGQHGADGERVPYHVMAASDSDSATVTPIHVLDHNHKFKHVPPSVVHKNRVIFFKCIYLEFG